MTAKKRRTMNAVANHALRREANEARNSHNLERLREAGIPSNSGSFRPSRVVRKAERAYARFEAQRRADELLARLGAVVGLTAEEEDEEEMQDATDE